MRAAIGSDRRFFAISHPSPLRHSGRACLDSPARAASFTLETLECWLLLRMSYAFQLMSAAAIAGMEVPA